MYQALYRKYRPKTLDEIGGQDTIVKIIQNSIKNNRINHAYLFAGPRGTGKTSIAKIFAKMVNCERLLNGNPCGKCPSCLQQNNSDIIEIDAASNNGVDEIRELRNKVNLVPSYGKYKVYIIDEVHMLTTGAFNALLKTLEEPPAHIIFILATTDPHKIPETILSRCQRLDFKKISDTSIVNRLKEIAEKENIDIEEDALKEIARLSDGGMRDSIGMLDQAYAYANDKITAKDIHDINGTITAADLKDLINVISTRKIKEIFEMLDKYNSNGKNFVKLTEEIITFMRNVLLCKNAHEYFTQINNHVENYENISQTMDTQEILKYIEILNQTLLEMKNTNNTKLLLELAIIKILDNPESEQTSKKTEQTSKKSEQTVVKHEQNVEKTIENVENSQESLTSRQHIEKNILPKSMIVNKEVQNNVNFNNIVVEKNRTMTVDGRKELEHIQEIRINNTLANFSKKHMQEIKSKLNSLNDYLLDPDISTYASIILDGTLKAASDTNLIFVYKTTRTTNLFNENILNVEKTIEKVLNKDYKVIATNIDNWETIKNEFNSKKKSYNYIEEDFNIENLYEKEEENDEFADFKDIIEYS